MLNAPKSTFRISPAYQPICRELGIDADAIFAHPLIKPWRSLSDRENCILDATLSDGRKVRWHIKRYQPALGFNTPADDEVKGHRALVVEQIPTAELIGWGSLPDRRCFVIFDDLSGYDAADKLIESGRASFEQLLEPTADLAARLHQRGLHHRDLYLCHFFVKIDSTGAVDVRLIDPARVKRLPGLFTRTRWIVKDLAQFWYSTTKLPSTDEQRTNWLKRYSQQRGGVKLESLARRVRRKVAWIARHDARLRKQQPSRNISIPAT